MIEIRLYGALRRRWGKSYRLAVRTGAEAVRALCVVLPGFKEHILKHSEPGYRVWLGGEQIKDAGELGNPTGKVVRIVPVTAGAKSAGLGGILLGVALIGASFFTGGATLLGLSVSGLAFNMGVSLVLGGVAQMLAGNPKASTPSERPDNQPSYAFNGAVNTTAQGQPVPILYGRARVGSSVISAGLSVAQLPA